MNKIKLSNSQQTELLDSIHKRLLQVQIDLESVIGFNHMLPNHQHRLLHKYKVEVTE